jgi:hypothetical protein
LAGVRAVRDALVRDVRNREQERVELGLDVLVARLEVLDAIGRLLHRSGKRGDVLARGLPAADVLGRGVALSAELFGLLEIGKVFAIERDQPLDVDRGAPSRHPGPQAVGFFPDETTINH